MSSVTSVTYDAFGPSGTGLTPGAKGLAPSEEMSTPLQAVRVPAPETGAGTLADVTAANAAAKASADIFSNPSTEYADAMAQAVRTAARAPKLGEHLDAMM
jgi:hypothetical protein